jgi:hypothetical protein
MSQYFTVDAATSRDVIFAYRGDDNQNSLGAPVPPDGQAEGTLKLPAGMTADNIERFLAQSFVTLAVGNPGHRILICLGDDRKVTYWLVALPPKA